MGGDTDKYDMSLKKLFSHVIPYTCILCGMKSDRLQDLCMGCYRMLPFQSELDGALLAYEPPISDLIVALKFQHKLVHARVLGELLAEKCRVYYENNPKPEIIIPIPLHRDRLIKRGFNQALEISRPVAHLLHIPLYIKNINRIKPTRAQATLPKSKRQSNVADAFHTVCGYHHVAVVDDVLTTGNTMEEFCRSLKSSGVEKIDRWVVAKPTRVCLT